MVTLKCELVRMELVLVAMLPHDLVVLWFSSDCPGGGDGHIEFDIYIGLCLFIRLMFVLGTLLGVMWHDLEYG